MARSSGQSAYALLPSLNERRHTSRAYADEFLACTWSRMSSKRPHAELSPAVPIMNSITPSLHYSF